MTHAYEIWRCIVSTFPKNSWLNLDEIYGLISNTISLDSDDHEPEANGSSVPKWKRNIRNVLQYRKKTGQVEWDKNGKYKIIT